MYVNGRSGTVQRQWPGEYCRRDADQVPSYTPLHTTSTARYALVNAHALSDTFQQLFLKVRSTVRFWSKCTRKLTFESLSWRTWPGDDSYDLIQVLKTHTLKVIPTFDFHVH